MFSFKAFKPALYLLTCLTIYSNCYDVSKHLATKTPYFPQNSSTLTPPPEGCAVVHVNLLARHGSREPSFHSIESFILLQQEFQKYQEYFNENYTWLTNWTEPYIEEEEGFLVYNGEEGELLCKGCINGPLLAHSTATIQLVTWGRALRAGSKNEKGAAGFLQSLPSWRLFNAVYSRYQVTNALVSLLTKFQFYGRAEVVHPSPSVYLRVVET